MWGGTCRENPVHTSTWVPHTVGSAPGISRRRREPEMCLKLHGWSVSVSAEKWIPPCCGTSSASCPRVSEVPQEGVEVCGAARATMIGREAALNHAPLGRLHYAAARPHPRARARATRLVVRRSGATCRVAALAAIASTSRRGRGLANPNPHLEGYRCQSGPTPTNGDPRSPLRGTLSFSSVIAFTPFPGGSCGDGDQRRARPRTGRSRRESRTGSGGDREQRGGGEFHACFSPAPLAQGGGRRYRGSTIHDERGQG